MSLAIRHHSMHLIMGAVSLWTRPLGPAPVCRASKTTPQLSRRHHPWQLTAAQFHCAYLSLLSNRDDST